MKVKEGLRSKQGGPGDNLALFIMAPDEHTMAPNELIASSCFLFGLTGRIAVAVTAPARGRM